MGEAFGQSWPLVGRTRELATIRRLLSSGGRGTVLAGVAGVGKTRLAVEAQQMAVSHGFVAAVATATRSAGSLPFGALAPLLPPGHHGEGLGVDTPAGLLRRYSAALLARTGPRRLALFVDDAHLLDDASATLVHQLAADDAAFVVLTVRSDEPGPDPVRALWKDGLLERVDVTALGVEAVEDLLVAILGKPVDHGTVLALAVRSMGNALFLRELVAGARQAGQLRDVSGLWRLVGPLSPSQRLVELVESRLEGLCPGERETLEVLSFGEPLGPDELLRFADLATVETLERKGLLASRSSERRLELRLAHPVFADVLRSRVSALRQRTIARELAEAVEASGAQRREDLLRVATWRLDGGGADPESLVASAKTARWRYDFPLAERLARAALAAGAGFDAALLAAQLAGRQGRSAQAERELEALAHQCVSDAQRGLVVINRLDNQVFSLGRIDEGLAMAEEAEAAISDQSWRDEITARRSGILLATRGFTLCAQASRPLLSRAAGRPLVWACFNVAFSSARLGQLAEALDAASRGHAAHLALTEPLDWDPCVNVKFRCDTLAYSGDFGAAEELAQREYERAVVERNLEAQAFFAWHLSMTVTDRGHVRSAVRYGREAVALFRQLGRPQLMQFAMPFLILALAVGGDIKGAQDAVDEHDALELPPTQYFSVDLLRARAWLSVARGDLPGAHDLLLDAVSHSEEIGDRVGGSAALHSLARIGYADAAVGKLTELAPHVEGALIGARLRHVTALASGDGQELAAASTVFEEMGARLLAAEAAADSGVVWRRLGRARDAAAAGARANWLLQGCEGASTPAIQTIEGRARITRAEREVVMLAVAGLSNRAIADRLCLSIRTVQNHLQRVYTKLGISGGRADLDAALKILQDGGNDE